jgi:hypothetical protein
MWASSTETRVLHISEMIINIFFASTLRYTTCYLTTTNLTNWENPWNPKFMTRVWCRAITVLKKLLELLEGFQSVGASHVINRHGRFFKILELQFSLSFTVFFFKLFCPYFLISSKLLLAFSNCFDWFYIHYFLPHQMPFYSWIFGGFSELLNSF